MWLATVGLSVALLNNTVLVDLKEATFHNLKLKLFEREARLVVWAQFAD